MVRNLENYISEVSAQLSNLGALDEYLQLATRKIVESISAGGKLLVCGNGGSAADAQHIAGEFVGKFLQHRSAYAAIALSTDTSILTSLGNDISYDVVFQRQVEALGKASDVLLGISTSGRSKNVLEAVKEAKQMEIFTIGLLGGDGGSIGSEVDLPIIVGSDSTPIIQVCHSLIYHALCEQAEDMLANR